MAVPMMVDYNSRNNNFVGMRKDDDVREATSIGLESMERLIRLLSQQQYNNISLGFSHNNNTVISLVLLEVET